MQATQIPNVTTHTLIDGLTGFCFLAISLVLLWKSGIAYAGLEERLCLRQFPFMTLSFSGQFHWQLFVLRGAARGAVPLPAAALPLAAPAVPLAAMPL